MKKEKKTIKSKGKSKVSGPVTTQKTSQKQETKINIKIGDTQKKKNVKRGRTIYRDRVSYVSVPPAVSYFPLPQTTSKEGFPVAPNKSLTSILDPTPIKSAGDVAESIKSAGKMNFNEEKKYIEAQVKKGELTREEADQMLERSRRRQEEDLREFNQARDRTIANKQEKEAERLRKKIEDERKAEEMIREKGIKPTDEPENIMKKIYSKPAITATSGERVFKAPENNSLMPPPKNDVPMPDFEPTEEDILRDVVEVSPTKRGRGRPKGSKKAVESPF